MQSTPPVRATNMLLPHRLQHAFFLVFMVTTIVKNYCKLYKYQFSQSDILIDFDVTFWQILTWHFDRFWHDTLTDADICRLSTYLPLTLILMVISTGLFYMNGGSKCFYKFEFLCLYHFNILSCFFRHLGTTNVVREGKTPLFLQIPYMYTFLFNSTLSPSRKASEKFLYCIFSIRKFKTNFPTWHFQTMSL